MKLMSNVNKKLNYILGGISKKAKKKNSNMEALNFKLCINTIQCSNLSDKLKYSAVKDH